MSIAKSICSIIVDYPPSCIEFSAQHPELFLIGTYLLLTPTEVAETVQAIEQYDNSTVDQAISQTREGSILLFRLEGNEMYFLIFSSHDSALLMLS
jgi:diphthamide biosynthesis protein 7